MRCRVSNCPLCYANVRGRAAYKGHRAYYPAEKRPQEIDMAIVKKVTPKADVDREMVIDDGCNWPSEFPGLWEYLTLTKFPDGAPRQTATLMVTMDDGTFKGCLNDRANGRSAWVSSRSPTGLLHVLEARLQEDSLEWRKNQSWQGRRK